MAGRDQPSLATPLLPTVRTSYRQTQTYTTTTTNQEQHTGHNQGISPSHPSGGITHFFTISLQLSRYLGLLTVKMTSSQIISFQQCDIVKPSPVSPISNIFCQNCLHSWRSCSSLWLNKNQNFCILVREQLKPCMTGEKCLRSLTCQIFTCPGPALVTLAST